MRFRVKILESSVKTGARLFDVEAEGRIEALIKAAVNIASVPFDAQDFRVEPLKYFFQKQDLFSVAHKRLEWLKFKIQIESTQF